MLKQFLVADGKVANITVEERYEKWVEQLRTDRYVTAPRLANRKHKFCLAKVTKLQLYKIYGKSSSAKSFINELVKGTSPIFSVARHVTKDRRECHTHKHRTTTMLECIRSSGMSQSLLALDRKDARPSQLVAACVESKPRRCCQSSFKLVCKALKNRAS